jgi:hypothetical protein
MDFAASAAAEAGFPGFVPDSCLINLYVPGAKSYTRAVTDFGKHHQRRIVASTEPLRLGWIADIALVERALDSMPDVPSR